MTVEDYTALIQKIVTDPDTAQANATTLLEEIKADDAKRVQDADTIKNQNERIDKLTKANSDLFLSATGGKRTEEKTEEEEKTPKQIFNELFDARFYPDKGDK